MTKIAIVIPATTIAMIMTITTKTEAMTAADDWPNCGVVSSTLDDTGDIADTGATVDCTLEEPPV